MKIIGLTGGIGTGKSTASGYLRKKGCKIIDADGISREMTAEGGEAIEPIRAHFGNTVFFEDGSLNRKKLGEIVFRDKSELKVLESITTEIVVKKIIEQLERLKLENYRGIVILDAPLLFEFGMERYTDENWLVSVEHKVRVDRIMLRDGLSRECVTDRIKSQMPEEKKKALADVIIDNTGGLEDLYRQIDSLIERLNYENE